MSWVDRDADLARIKEWLVQEPADTVAVVVVTGPSGVGKTALATRLLHDMWAAFPGGHLQVDLQGPARTGDVLSRMLHALRPGDHVPPVLDLGQWWRSATSAAPPLAVLADNAVSGRQIVDLLPGGPGHVVVVTAGTRLPDLAAYGAFEHRVAPLHRADADRYLLRCLESTAVPVSPAVRRRLIAESGGLPLALAAAVARAATETTRLPPFHTHTCEDTITMTIRAAYNALPPRAQRVCRRFALLPDTITVDEGLAIAVGGASHRTARSLLAALVQAQFLTADGEELGRGPVFSFRMSARDYVRDRARTEETESSGTLVLTAALDWLLATASDVETRVTPSHAVHPRTYTTSPIPVQFPSDQQAMAWMGHQLPNVMAAIRAGNAAGLHRQTSALVHAMWPAWQHYRHYPWWIEAHRLGVRAARECGAHALETVLLNTLGVGYRNTGEHNDALNAFKRTLDQATARSDRTMVSQALHELGVTHHNLGQYPEACQYLHQALEMRTEDHYVRGMGLTETELGRLDLACSDATAAAARLSRAVSLLTESEDRYNAARAAAFWSRALSGTGDLNAAQDRGLHAHAELTGCGAHRWAAHTLEFLGLNALDHNHRGDAADWFRQSLNAYERLPFPADTARLKVHLDRLARA
ncbi:tetratricopeptide repeat protein [Streptomyces sp. NPDC056061]|uniref:tetratricopeptide repeat protein n=1 Tax=Streptomyces sp. NPDC056061 TaxID=3345700 RepID=UPI0035D5F49E